MSKILIFEPHRMLRQAIALVLFADHDIQFAMSIPDAAELKDYDAVIIDGGALVNDGKYSDREIRMVQSWQVPTIWLDGGANGQTPQREGLVAVKVPITRASLSAALADCLRNFAKAQSPDRSVDSKVKEGDVGAGLIELVDVVEEGAEVGS